VPNNKRTEYLQTIIDDPHASDDETEQARKELNANSAVGAANDIDKLKREPLKMSSEEENVLRELLALLDHGRWDRFEVDTYLQRHHLGRDSELFCIARDIKLVALCRRFGASQTEYLALLKRLLEYSQRCQFLKETVSQVLHDVAPLPETIEKEFQELYAERS
jgi:hypothetical protein